MGLHLIDVLPTPKRFLEERLRPRSLILPPDPPESAHLITQFVGKRTVRDIPSTVRVNANFPLHGIRDDAWAEPPRLRNADGVHASRFPWPSVSALLGAPLEGPGKAEGVAISARTSTYPPKTLDVEAMARSLSSHTPHVVISTFAPTGHPKWRSIQH